MLLDPYLPNRLQFFSVLLIVLLTLDVPSLRTTDAGSSYEVGIAPESIVVNCTRTAGSSGTILSYCPRRISSVGPGRMVFLTDVFHLSITGRPMLVQLLPAVPHQANQAGPTHRSVAARHLHVHCSSLTQTEQTVKRPTTTDVKRGASRDSKNPKYGLVPLSVFALGAFFGPGLRFGVLSSYCDLALVLFTTAIPFALASASAHCAIRTSRHKRRQGYCRPGLSPTPINLPSATSATTCLKSVLAATRLCLDRRHKSRTS